MSYSPRRSNWQEAISEIAYTFGVSAVQAAEILSPYWTGVPEHHEMHVQRPNLTQEEEDMAEKIAEKYKVHDRIHNRSPRYRGGMHHRSSPRYRYSPRHRYLPY